MPSYVTSTDCATALHQKGGALIVKSRIVPRVALKTVNESGRPSPSSRVCDVKYSHHGYKSVCSYAVGVIESDAINLFIHKIEESDLPVSFDTSLSVCIDNKICSTQDEPGGLVLRESKPANVYHIFRHDCHTSTHLNEDNSERICSHQAKTGCPERTIISIQKWITSEINSLYCESPSRLTSRRDRLGCCEGSMSFSCTALSSRDTEYFWVME